MSINTPFSAGRTLQRSAFFVGHLRPVQLSASTPRLQQTYAQLQTVCQLSDKGRIIDAASIKVRSSIGEGSYGQVFEGVLDTPAGPERVVLKRVKSRVEGAVEMGQMEHLLNVYASRSAKSSIASFVGYCEVQPDEANRNLTEGLWLLWQYEGGKTLAHYLRRRDCIQRLAKDMDIPEEAVVPTVMQQIFEGLSGLHAAGLVHRDVKPLNIIFGEEERRFKLIDLGACADLRTGTNYIPDESILDPTYCPPEQYCMPTDSPHLAKQLKPLAIAMSPMLWSRFKPDRFDSFSCGLVLMQLAIPKLRLPAGIKQFNLQYKKVRFDLQTWRASALLPARETAILDANGGVGWDLAGALLRPRDIQVDDRGGVVFVNRGGAIRLPVKAALKHRFLRQAKVPQAAQVWRRGTGSRKKRWGPSGTVTAPSRVLNEGASLIGSAVGFWKAASGRLKDLEFKLSNQERAVAIQTGRVEVLKTNYADGRVKKEVLDRQQSLLSKMTGRLNKLQGELGATSATAQRVLSFLGPKDKLSNQARAVAVQKSKVEALKSDFATGKIRRGELERQEGLLQKMMGRLGSLQDELNTTAAGAQRVFSFFQPKQQQAGLSEPAPAEQPLSSAQRILNTFLRADRLESSLLTELDSSDDETSELQWRQRTGYRPGTGLTKRSTPDGNVTDGTEGMPRRFSIFRKPKEVSAPPPPAPATRRDMPPSFLSKKRGTTGTQGQEAPASASGTEQRSLGQSAAGAAVTGIYAGLKLTGLALRVATDMATSLSKDAEQAFATNEAQRALKRKQRAATNAFLELLRECNPPVRPQSKWTDTRRFVVKDPRFTGLDENQRSTIFADYVTELSRAEENRLRRGEETFKELLADVGLSRESTLEAVEARLASDARFGSLPDNLDTDRIFAEALEMRVPEFDFWDLLRECSSPPLNKETTWGQARRQIVGDPRFEAISERQRRAVFRAFVESIEEPETAPACLLPVASMNVALGSEAPETVDAVEASKESLGSLQALRAEQARLKNAYAEMEAKLRSMERKLQDQEGSASSSMDLGSMPEGINGALTHNMLPRRSR